jgi:hypothetical protein
VDFEAEAYGLRSHISFLSWLLELACRAAWVSISDFPCLFPDWRAELRLALEFAWALCCIRSSAGFYVISIPPKPFPSSRLIKAGCVVGRSSGFILAMDDKAWRRAKASVHGYFRQIYVTDPDVPKDSNLTCEILANILTHLKDMSVSLSSDVVLHIQGDNTCRENKNNTTMKFAAALVGFSRVVVAEQEYLITGHTHEDIDQLLGRLARFLLRQHRLEDPAASVRAISGFMQDFGQTTEVWHNCVKLDFVRNWKEWLSHVAVHVSGVGGPGAPHRFRFERRSNVIGPIVTPKLWEQTTPHKQDVILTAWCRMSDPVDSPSTKPTLHVPYAELLKLPRSGPSNFAPRNPLEKQFKDELLKMATKIRGAPYHMGVAALWMERWVAGTFPKVPPLSVGYVADMGCGLQQAAAQPQIALAETVDSLDTHPNELRIGKPPAQRVSAAVEQPPSAKARFVYPTAVHIWSRLLARDPASWSAALQQAKDMWANMAPAAAACFQVDDDDKEEEGEGDDVPLLLEDG